MGRIRVGIAGWDYPDWRGVVYPVPTPRGFDRLAYIAGFVDVVEVNSTFYRAPDPRTCASWVRRTATSSVAFTAKAHRACTHDDGDPTAELAATLDGLEPLRESGLLRAVLLQFPQRFHDTDRTRGRVERLIDSLAGWSPVVEFRHVSWDTDDAADWLGRHGAGWCVIDQPRPGRSSIGTVERTSAAVAYLRLHGRNVANWFREDAGRDARYDYLYERTQLAALAEAAGRLGENAQELFVVQNNHFRGQALANALELKHMIHGERLPAPAPLVRAYPRLRDISHVGQPDLF